MNSFSQFKGNSRIIYFGLEKKGWRHGLIAGDKKFDLLQKQKSIQWDMKDVVCSDDIWVMRVGVSPIMRKCKNGDILKVPQFANSGKWERVLRIVNTEFKFGRCLIGSRCGVRIERGGITCWRRADVFEFNLVD